MKSTRHFLRLRQFFAAGLPHAPALALAILVAPLPVRAQQTPQKSDAQKTEAPQSEAPVKGSIETIEVAPRTVVEMHDAANWEDGYARIGQALEKLRAAAQKAGLKVVGRPMAAFTETDDAGFKFDALIDVDAPAGASADLGADVRLTQSPSGKAIRFKHRGAYDDIDTTYEAITAYLDEKGLEARDLFIEEYVNDARDSSDNGAQVDIYVFLK